MEEKLSAIVIEMAETILNAPGKDVSDESANAALLLVLVAWNRDVYGDNFASEGVYKQLFNELEKSNSAYRESLESVDFEKLIEGLRKYKRTHYPNDNRYINTCGINEKGNVNVQWEYFDQTHGKAPVDLSYSFARQLRGTYMGKNNSVGPPVNYEEAVLSSDELDDEDEYFDVWCEGDYFLREKGDYPALLKHREERLARFPDDPYAQCRVGQAYVLNGKYQAAIDFLEKYLKEFPENKDFQYTVLDALFALGKDENDFDWVEKPVVLRLTQEIIDSCYQFLKPKRKPRSVDELHMQFLTEGYITFSHEYLLKALMGDDRFVVLDHDSSPYSAMVSVVRKRKKTR
jgi:tetratricopeptide (TPR) repeat protein